MNEEDKDVISGSGFHCRINIDLKKVKSIQRCAFWNRGWWYSCEYHTAERFDIHVRDGIDLVKLFKESLLRKHDLNK